MYKTCAAFGLGPYIPYAVDGSRMDEFDLNEVDVIFVFYGSRHHNVQCAFAILRRPFLFGPRYVRLPAATTEPLCAEEVGG